MRDPFRTDTKTQLIREAQIGLSVVAVMLALLLYVAFYKMTGRGRAVPDHVRDAPIAQFVNAEPNSARPPIHHQQTNRLEDSSSSQNSIPPDRHVSREPGTPLVQHNEVRRPDSQNTETAGASLIENAASSDLSVPLNSTTRLKPEHAARRESSSQIARSLNNLIEKFGSRKKTDVRSGTTPESKSVTIGPHTAKSPCSDNRIESQPFKIVKAKPFSRHETSSASRSEISPGINGLRPIKPESTSPISAEVGLNNQTPNVQLTSAESSDTAFEPANNFSPNNGFAEEAGVESTQEQSGYSPSIEQNSNSTKPAENAALETSKNNDFAVGDFNPNDGAFSTLSSPVKLEPKKWDGPASVANVNRDGPAGLRSEFSPIEIETDSLSTHTPSMEAPKPLRQPSSNQVNRLPRPGQADIARPNPVTDSTQLDASPLVTNQTVIDNTPQQLTYVVKDGDTYWSIAQQRYQDGQFFRALYEHNKRAVPEFEVSAGAQLVTPAKADLIKLWPEFCPIGDPSTATTSTKTGVDDNSIYVTKQGDTLYAIARQKLGQASRYLEIHANNKQLLEFDVRSDTPLRPGMRLELPSH